MGRVGIVVLLALTAYTAFVIIHALIVHHPETGVFWAAIALLCMFLLLLLGVLSRVMRSRRPR